MRLKRESFITLFGWSVFGLAILLNIAQILFSDAQIQPDSDSEFYYNWALAINQGRIADYLPFPAQPGYPLALSLLRILVLGSIKGLLITQALFILGCGILFYHICKMVFSKECAGIALLMFGLYPSFFMYTRILTPEPFGLFLMCLSCYTLLKGLDNPNNRKAMVSLLGAGLIGGFAVITRPNLLLPVIGIFAVCAYMIVKELGKGTRILKAFLPFIALGVFLGFVLAINSIAAGCPFLSTAHTGLNFYIGNNPSATGLFYTGGRFRPTQKGLLKDSRLYAERALGKRLEDREVSEFYKDKAFYFIYTQPFKALGLLLKKTALVFNKTAYHDAEGIPRHPMGILDFSFIFPLSLLAFWDTRKNIKAALLRQWLILGILSTVLFFVNERYRLIVILPAIGLAAQEVLFLFKERRRLPLRMAVLAGLFFVGRIEWIPKDTDPYVARYNKAVGYLNDNKCTDAKEALERLIEEKNNDAMVLFAYGNALYCMGRYEEAVDAYIRTIRINPLFVDAYVNAAKAYMELGRFELAKAFLLRAKEMDFEQDDINYNLMLIAIETGDCQAAKQYRKQIGPQGYIEREIIERLESCQ